jgi:hypothetical protein
MGNIIEMNILPQVLVPIMAKHDAHKCRVPSATTATSTLVVETVAWELVPKLRAQKEKAKVSPARADAVRGGLWPPGAARRTIYCGS